MSNKLTRQQLSKFLADQESVKFFENLFIQALVTSPTLIEELTALLLGRRHDNATAINSRLEVLEQLVTQRQNLSDITQRLEALELKVYRRSSSTDLQKRIETLEALLGI